MRKTLVVALALLGFIALAGPVVGQDDAPDFRADLNGFLEVPSISTTGHGQFAAQRSGATIVFRLRYNDLSGPPSAAHIHFARPDVIGGVIAFLCGGGSKPACPASGLVTGTIAASDVIGPAARGIAPGEFVEMIRAMRNGATYVNVHTALYPDGEIRGNIR